MPEADVAADCGLADRDGRRKPRATRRGEPAAVRMACRKSNPGKRLREKKDRCSCPPVSKLNRLTSQFRQDPVPGGANSGSSSTCVERGDAERRMPHTSLSVYSLSKSVKYAQNPDRTQRAKSGTESSGISSKTWEMPLNIHDSAGCSSTNPQDTCFEFGTSRVPFLGKGTLVPWRRKGCARMPCRPPRHLSCEAPLRGVRVIPGQDRWPRSPPSLLPAPRPLRWRGMHRGRSVRGEPRRVCRTR